MKILSVIPGLTRNPSPPKNWIPAFAGMTVLLLFSFWLMFHTFGYDRKTNSILIASRLWSDFGANIPLIRSFSLGANVDRMLAWKAPDYPIYAGEPIRKHFLFYALVGGLERMGLRIDWALNVPSIAGFFALLLGIYLLAQTLFRSKTVALLSVLFFLCNGSLSFVRYFSEHSIKDLATIREFPAFAPWGPGDITAFWNLNIYTNQRHLAAGFAIGIWFLLWVVRSKKTTLSTILWGIVIGTLPYFHQPMLLIMAILLPYSFLFFPKSRAPLFFIGVIATALIVPQLLIMPKSNALSWYPGYFIHDDLTLSRFGSYWFQNLGLHAILIPLGFLFIPKIAKKTLFPLFIIFLVANLFRFSVEVAASHKFFNFALILGSMISAYVVFSLRKRLRGIISVLLIGILTLSGIIDFFVVKNDVRGSVDDADPRVLWIAKNTEPDAIFLNSSFLYHPASIAGRSIFLGWPYFAWSEGYIGNRDQVMNQIYESEDPSVFCPILALDNISYVTVEDTHGDPNLPTIDLDYFQDRFHAAYETKDHTFMIFSTDELCNEI